jgi:hypothetical protein
MTDQLLDFPIPDDLEDVLRIKLGEYALLLEDQNIAEQNKTVLQDTLLKDPKYAKAKASCEDLRLRIEAVRKEIDGIALDMYSENGNKHPIPAITVINSTNLVYPIEDAIKFCCQHFLGGLTLNKTAFEKYVRAVQDSNPIDFVKIKFDQKVRLSSDLSDYRPDRPV